MHGGPGPGGWHPQARDAALRARAPAGVRGRVRLPERSEGGITPNLPTKIIPILRFVDSNFPGNVPWT